MDSYHLTVLRDTTQRHMYDLTLLSDMSRGELPEAPFSMTIAEGIDPKGWSRYRSDIRVGLSEPKLGRQMLSTLCRVVNAHTFGYR